MSKNVSSIPSCDFNKGVICPKLGRDCFRCGWNPKEERRRKEKIERGELKQDRHGNWYFQLSKRKGDEE